MSEQPAPKNEVLASYGLTGDLEIKLVNLSRRLAGDRYLFALEARLNIPLSECGLDKQSRALLERVFKDSIPFVHRYERNFVDEKDLESLTAKMKGEFETTLLPYLKRDDIKDRIVSAKLKELKANFWKFELSPNDVAFLV